MRLKVYIVFVIGAWVLAGCAPQPVTPPLDRAAVEARARALAEAGDGAAAITLYRDLADATAGVDRVAYLLEGAELLVARGDTATAERWLEEAELGANAEQQNLILTLRARIAQAAGDPELALATLSRLRPPITVPVLRRASEVRARAFFALNRHAEGVRELVERETWLETAEEVLANQRLIWDALVPPPTSPPTGDPIVDGWLALAEPAQAQNDPAEFRRRLLDWRRTYVNHPAASGILAELMREQRVAGERPGKIALLLPLASAQRTEALAVRDGFMAAHLESGALRETTVSVYDTGARGATSAYLQAQLDGAEFIVGPLLRTEVEAVLEQSGFVPTLGLNWAQAEAPGLSNFYQFGLAPEDEVSAIVRQAVAAGHRTAVALVASDERGYRLLNSFRTEFEAVGGRLLNSAGYVPNAQDVSGAIRDLLNVSRSEQRHRRLEANLGVEIGFEARRRQDIDMIFMQASPPMGRLLAPNLRFYYAGDVPTFATAEIYEPGNRAADSDLEGVVFPVVPLLLSADARSSALTEALKAHWPQRATQYLGLYGLGFDAYTLVGALFSLGAAAWPLEGFSGRLDLDPLGKIRRDLPFAQFRNGRPALLIPQVAAFAPP
jgi:outer membrane PBP1 activator LpoA protein